MRRLCGKVMYACHSIRRPCDNAERTAVDIKAHIPLIRFVVGVLYLTQFLYKMASADDLGDALLTCSSVYVASAAIGLVLSLVLRLNLGLGQLCRKVGTGRLCTQAHSSH